MPPTRTSELPAATVYFHIEEHFSGAFPDMLIVKTVPIAFAPDETNRQTETQTPSAATPPTVFVYSPNFVQVPVPPVTDVWVFVSPSAVAMLSVTTTRMPMSPELDRALVCVVC